MLFALPPLGDAILRVVPLRHVYRLDPEGEFFLGQVAERNHYHRGEDLGDGGINMELLHKHLDEDIVQENADHHQHKIAPQLHAAPEGGPWKYHMPVKIETGGKADGERHDESGDIWAHRTKRSIEYLFFENKIVADKIDHNIQESVASAAYRIAERLQRHHLSKGWIKKVYEPNDPLLGHILN